MTEKSSSNPKDNNESSSPKESRTERSERFMATGQAHLHASVTRVVEMVNSGLASMEQSTRNIQAPIVQGWRTASTWEQKLEHQLNVHVYQRRHEIGPQLVVGTTVAGGTLTALLSRRRPRTLAFVSGSIVMGTIAYLTVYEPLPIKRIPDLVLEQLHLKKKDP
jgi:hypothetical protein